MNNQLSFNKMIETQLDQFAAFFYLFLSRVESRGNTSLPESMLAPYPPDG
jgi:hypothetical protein